MLQLDAPDLCAPNLLSFFWGGGGFSLNDLDLQGYRDVKKGQLPHQLSYKFLS